MIYNRKRPSYRIVKTYQHGEWWLAREYRDGSMLLLRPCYLPAPVPHF